MTRFLIFSLPYLLGCSGEPAAEPVIPVIEAENDDTETKEKLTGAWRMDSSLTVFDDVDRPAYVPVEPVTMVYHPDGKYEALNKDTAVGKWWVENEKIYVDIPLDIAVEVPPLQFIIEQLNEERLQLVNLFVADSLVVETHAYYTRITE